MEKNSLEKGIALGLIHSSIALLVFTIGSNRCHAQTIDEATKRYSFARQYFKNKQYRDAIKNFWKVIEHDTTGKYLNVYRFLGSSYLNLCPPNPDSAQLVFSLGIERRPNDAYLHRNLRFLYTQREQIPEAIKHGLRVVEIDSGAVEDWKALARLYFKNDKIDDAIRSYRKSLESFSAILFSWLITSSMFPTSFIISASSLSASGSSRLNSSAFRYD